jgi:hypothetical protein
MNKHILTCGNIQAQRVRVGQRPFTLKFTCYETLGIGLMPPEHCTLRLKGMRNGAENVTGVTAYGGNKYDSIITGTQEFMLIRLNMRRESTLFAMKSICTS